MQFFSLFFLKIYAAIEAMADGGVKMGLPRNLALSLAAHTVGSLFKSYSN